MLENKTFYISELALGMLAETQKNNDVYLPESNVFAGAEAVDWHKELFALASKGVVKISAEEDCFNISDELLPVLNNVFTAKAIMTVTDVCFNRNFIYYVTSLGITELSKNSSRKGYGLTLLDAHDLSSWLQEKLRLPEEYSGSTLETDIFINSVEEHLNIKDPLFSVEHLNMSIDEIKETIDDVMSVIDVFSCEEKKVVSRIVIYQRSVYYKIAEISSKGVSIVSYNGISFDDAINNCMGEEL